MSGNLAAGPIGSRQAEGLCEVLEVKGKPFTRAIMGLRDVQEIVQQEPSWLTGDKVVTWIDELVPQLNNLGCRQTLKKLQAIRYLHERDYPHFQNYDAHVKAASLVSSLKEVWSRLEDELEDQRVYCVSEKEAGYLMGTAEIFGEDVAASFQEETQDLEEASKALAFSRGTACVFHLMRAMESAVSRIGVRFSVTIIDAKGDALAWGKILANVRTPIEAMAPGRLRDDWSEIQSLLYHVKQAWRNSTMHPKHTYTIDEAKDVFSAVRTFLRRLAPLL